MACMYALFKLRFQHNSDNIQLRRVSGNEWLSYQLSQYQYSYAV